MTKTRIKCGILILCALTFFAGAARAEDGAGRGVGTATGLPLPRFVSLKSDEVNARIEPGAIVDIMHCDGEDCEVYAGSQKGWVPQKNLWGVYPSEKVK